MLLGGSADNIPVDAPPLIGGRTLLLGQADPRRQEPRPTLRPKDTRRRAVKSLFGSGLGSTFDPTRTVARAGHQRFNTGIALVAPLTGVARLLRRPSAGRATGGVSQRHRWPANAPAAAPPRRRASGSGRPWLIGRFGGNPHNVTVFGESAGGLSTLAQVASPQAMGLFEKAIVESGSYNLTRAPLATAESAGEAFASKVGCADQTAACLRSPPVSTILAGENAAGYTPNINTEVLPEALGAPRSPPASSTASRSSTARTATSGGCSSRSTRSRALRSRPRTTRA